MATVSGTGVALFVGLVIEAPAWGAHWGRLTGSHSVEGLRSDSGDYMLGNWNYCNLSDSNEMRRARWNSKGFRIPPGTRSYTWWDTKRLSD